jgi:UDP-N-acetylmuramyl tripeptide synthase
VFNGQDPLLVKSANSLAKEKVVTRSFGVVNKLTPKMRNEQNMFSKDRIITKKFDTMLVELQEKKSQQQVKVDHKGELLSTELNLDGLHNALNATAVCSLLAVLEPIKYQKMFVAINTMHAPFGRGEILSLNNKIVTVALVKNPSGFMHNLETFVENKSPEHILFIVNDRFADGRDVSWLWDVQFRGLIPKKANIICSGLRAYDMALRLKHDGYQSEVIPDVKKAVKKVMKQSISAVTIIPTYTALYEARAALSEYGKVPRIW